MRKVDTLIILAKQQGDCRRAVDRIEQKHCEWRRDKSVLRMGSSALTLFRGRGHQMDDMGSHCLWWRTQMGEALLGDVG